MGLNTSASAQVSSVSCASAGNCGAGGFYSHGSNQEAFVADEAGGAWDTGQEVAGALNAGGTAGINSVSCVSAGNCSAGGYYRVGGQRDEYLASGDGRPTGQHGIAPSTSGSGPPFRRADLPAASEWVARCPGGTLEW